MKHLIIQHIDFTTQINSLGIILRNWLQPVAVSLGGWRATWTARRNKEMPDEGAVADLVKRIVTLELDLQERDKEIRQLRQEYELQREQAARQQNVAATMAFETLVRQLVSPLAQLATMRAVAEKEREVRVADVFKIFDQCEQILTKAGLTRIGAVGSAVPFDSRWHQRLGGADLHDNDPVVIRFVGYRLGATILRKALVNYQRASNESQDASNE